MATGTFPINMWERLSTLWARNAARRVSESIGNPTPDGGGPETVFLLLGGAARGAAQAGALTILLERGIIPDLIIGISAGAWNGAFLALDPTPARAFELEGLWVATTSQQMLGSHWRAGMNAVGRRASLYGSDGVSRVAARHIAGRSFEDLRVPLRIVASDLVSGEAAFFESGPLERAVLASSAIPGIFPPLVDGDRVLVDGGLVEWAACRAALDSGARRIVLVGCGSVTTPASKQQTFRHIWDRGREVRMRHDFERTVAALRGSGRDILAIYPAIASGWSLDFDHAPALIAAGRRAATDALAAKELTSSPDLAHARKATRPGRVSPHDHKIAG